MRKVDMLTEIVKMNDSDEVVGDIPDECAGATVILYEYKLWTYEGYGEMLILKDNLWYVHDMSHCSCYGPLDYLKDSMERGGVPFEKLTPIQKENIELWWNGRKGVE